MPQPDEIPEPDDPLARALAELGEIPADVVRPPGLTREVVLQCNAMYGNEVSLSEPGEVVCDVDGKPIGVADPVVSTATFMPLVISRAEADRLGFTDEEIPNVRIIDA